MKTEPESGIEQPARDKPNAATQVCPISAEQLFRGTREIVIRHQGDDYRLRITRNDKLILTK